MSYDPKTDLHVSPPAYEAWRERLFRGDKPSVEELWGEESLRAPEWLLDYASRLFAEAGTLRDRYTSRELKRGLWALPQGWELSDLLWNRTANWAAREACVASMPLIFERLFRDDPVDTTCFMWWDMYRPIDPDHDERLWDVVFVALAHVLAIPSEECQLAALHGLGHVNHREKERLIRRFLAERPDLSPEVAAYAEASIAGKVL